MLWCRTRLTHPSPFGGLLLTATAPCPSRATLWRGGRSALRHGRGAMLEKQLPQQRSLFAASLRKPPTNSVSLLPMTLDRVPTWKCLEASTLVRLMSFDICHSWLGSVVACHYSYYTDCFKPSSLMCCLSFFLQNPLQNSGKAWWTALQSLVRSSLSLWSCLLSVLASGL